MAPLIVLVAATLIFRLLGRLGVRVLHTWRDAARFGLAVMLLFTAAAHFTPMKHDLARMIPAPLTGNLAVVSLTGLLEIAGALGILLPRTRRAAGIGLFLLLLAMFPANVSAARRGVTLRGEPATALLLRAPLQALFLGVIWWTAIDRGAEARGPRDRGPAGASRPSGTGDGRGAGPSRGRSPAAHRRRRSGRRSGARASRGGRRGASPAAPPGGGRSRPWRASAIPM